MADRSTHSTSTTGTGSSSKSSGAPAWKLREQMKKKQALDGGAGKVKRVNNSKFAKKPTTIDPNLPPAFRQVAVQRMAFERQQARRKNNDEFVSLNSTHVAKEPTQEEIDDMSSLGSDLSFGDSFGDLEEGDEGQDE